MNPSSLTLREKLLSLSIAMIYFFFIIFTLNAIFPPPKYEDFCSERIYENIPMNKEKCEEKGGLWRTGVLPIVKGNNTDLGWCDITFKCNKNFEVARKEHAGKIFISGLILGIITIYVGTVITLELVSTGLLFGGIILLIYISIIYFEFLPNWFKALLFGIALIILILLSYGRLKIRKNK